MKRRKKDRAAENPEDEPGYWLRQTPAARLRHLELLRRRKYGKAATGRMRKSFFEVVQMKTTKKRSPAKKG